MSKISIISGKLKSRNINCKSKHVGFRPTLSSIRKTIFDWLNHDLLNYDCLDLFAGSGILGFEALSNNAKHVTFVENNDLAVQDIKQNITALGLSNEAIICKCDSIKFLRNAINQKQKFDLIFLDPPYNSKLLQDVLYIIENNKFIISENGLIYLEFNKNNQPNLENFIIEKIKNSSDIMCGLISIKKS